MKLIVALSIEEHAVILRNLFRRHHVDIYSEAPIEGMKHSESAGGAGNWFVSRPDGVVSHLVFAFIDDQKSAELLEGIRAVNKKEHLANPIHAFQLHVDDQA